MIVHCGLISNFVLSVLINNHRLWVRSFIVFDISHFLSIALALAIDSYLFFEVISLVLWSPHFSLMESQSIGFNSFGILKLKGSTNHFSSMESDVYFLTSFVQRMERCWFIHSSASGCSQKGVCMTSFKNKSKTIICAHPKPAISLCFLVVRIYKRHFQMSHQPRSDGINLSRHMAKTVWSISRIHGQTSYIVDTKVKKLPTFIHNT